MSSDSEILARAYEYPYPTLESSWRLHDGEAVALAPGELDPALLAGRRPVLAYGANASPTGLARKLGTDADVVLQAGLLLDFDVVYSAHVAIYGAIPGALQHSSASRVRVHVAHLTDTQLELVHPGEPNYRFERLFGVELRLDDGAIMTAIDAYATRHGCLRHDGAEVALAPVAAEGRTLPELTQREVLAHVRDRLAPGEDLDAFVLAQVADSALAAQRTAALREDAIAFAWPR
ncbi:MAG: hypothetical protein ACR2NH_12595 [Solirubrobacteraceae bacterium]